MTIFLLARYAERARCRWLRDTILQPAGFKVGCSWIDTDQVSDALLTPEESARQRTVNRQEIHQADAVIYFPAWVPSPGRMVDLGMAVAFGKPIIVVDVERWEDLGWFDQTLYLRQARCCFHYTDLPMMLEGVFV